MMEDKQKEGKTTNSERSILIFGVDNQGVVIYFNRYCESITGFKKSQITGRKITDILIPKNFIQQWGNLFKNIVEDNTIIDDFIVPWVTSSGREILITCSILNHEPAEDKQNKHHYLIGKILDTSHVKPNTIDLEVQVSKEAADKTDKDTAPSKDHIRDQFTSWGNLIKTMDEKIDRIQLYISDMERRHDDAFNTIYAYVKKLDDKIEEFKNRLDTSLMISINTLADSIVKIKDQIDNYHKDALSLFTASKNKSAKRYPFTLSLSKKRRIVEEEMRDLEEKRNLLALYEAQLKEEKNMLESERATWVKWKEKLEQIESEIERRRQELVREEQYFRERILSSYNTNVNMTSSNGLKPEPVSVADIPQSAVIIQRGILKQVNSSFVSMVGYQPEELLEKHFFDLLTPEGLAEIERYHLGRLKGEEASTYATVISTKDNRSIPVEISVKPTIYNGERAEIALITVKTDVYLS